MKNKIRSLINFYIRFWQRLLAIVTLFFLYVFGLGIARLLVDSFYPRLLLEKWDKRKRSYWLEPDSKQFTLESCGRQV